MGRKKIMSIFAKKEGAICFTHLIIKVKQYDTGKSTTSPLFYLEKVINDGEKARKVVEKLNDLAEIGDDAETDKGWKIRYFSTQLTY